MSKDVAGSIDLDEPRIAQRYLTLVPDLQPSMTRRGGDQA